MSHPARGAWIETNPTSKSASASPVAPRTGCVNWNIIALTRRNTKYSVAPHTGCVNWGLILFSLRCREGRGWRTPIKWAYKNRIATWKILNLHVAIFYSLRRRESFPPKFHLIPPKNFFSSTWAFFICHVEIWKYPRGDLSLRTEKTYRKYGISCLSTC